MSTLAYAQFTNRREAAIPGTSTTTAPPGVKTYVDALAALVPAEALTLHGVILSVTTRTQGNATTITAPHTLAWAFWGLLVVTVGLYIAPRFVAKKWDTFDLGRMLIPPLALVGWMMLQRATAFDAVWPNLADPTRTVIAVFLAVVLGTVATVLAYKVDLKQP